MVVRLVWWKRPAAQAGLALTTLGMAAFSAIMLGTVHGLQNRVARLERTLRPPLAVWLMPDPERGASVEVPQIPDADVAAGLRATMVLPATIEAAVYTVTVTDTAHKVVWTSEALTGRGRSVTATIPPALLKPGDYRLDLAGGATTAAVTGIASYALRVIETPAGK